MLPEEVDYSYPTKPTHLASQLSNYNYGMPYDEYFGGVTLFNKYDFELVNGYSNEYIGWGFEDDDLLNRCYEKKLPMDIEWVGDPSKTTRPLTFVNFDGKKSFVEVHSKQIKSIFKDSYTISLWLKLDAIQDKKLNHYGIVSRPGYHTGIFIDRDNRLYCEMWSKNKKDDKTEWNVTSNIFGKDYFTQNTDSLLHLTMVHDKDNKILKFFINGKHVDNSPKNYMGDLYVHEDFPIYLGVAHPDYTEKSAFFKGAMTELCFWNTDLSDKEVRSIYNSSIPINPKRVNHDYKSIDNLVGYYDFKTHVQNKIFDVSENENHIFAKGTWFTAENLILGNYKISPHRRNGKYIVLLHEKTKGNEENHKLFLNKKDRKIDYLIDGLSTLKYKVVNKEKFMKKHWIYSAE